MNKSHYVEIGKSLKGIQIIYFFSLYLISPMQSLKHYTCLILLFRFPAIGQVDPYEAIVNYDTLGLKQYLDSGGDIDAKYSARLKLAQKNITKDKIEEQN